MPDKHSMTAPIRNRAKISGLIGLAITLAIAVLVLLAPVIAPYGQAEIIGEVWAPISSKAWLGTDSLGRDLLSRLLYGGRITLLIALAGTVLALLIGCVLGFTAAISGGWIDTVLARAVDAVMAIPTLIFALVLLSVLGTSIPVLIGTIACLASTRAFRLSRAIAGNIVALEYFEVARLRGERMPWLMFYEVLPNSLAPLTAEFGLRLCANFLFIAALSFLGLGIQPPLADWGGMVRDNASAISYGGLAPLIPAAAIGVFAIAINLVVDWILSVQAGEED
jgi:peptide/nickel transport system permease protein